MQAEKDTIREAMRLKYPYLAVVETPDGFSLQGQVLLESLFAEHSLDPMDWAFIVSLEEGPPTSDKLRERDEQLKKVEESMRKQYCRFPTLLEEYFSRKHALANSYRN